MEKNKGHSKIIDAGTSKKTNKFDILGLTAIGGINFKKAAELYVHLGVTNIEELYKACKEGKIQNIKGWGLSTQNRIKSEIELNVLWLHTQCTKLKKENSDISGQRFDKDFLLELVKEQAKTNLNKQDD